MYSEFIDFITTHQHICIIQAENPDGDSLGSALALDYLLPDHQISLYCPVDIPQYLHYFQDWSRISHDFDATAEAYIIVDTAAAVLLSKLLDDSVIANHLQNKPVFVLDHHETPDDLPFPHQSIIHPLPACCDLIYKIAANLPIPSPQSTDTSVTTSPAHPALSISRTAAAYLLQGILSDTLGLTTENVTADTFYTAGNLVQLGANIAELENRRREFMKKSPRILDYKADLIKRIEYHLDGQLATVHIPWADIETYSNEYNPNVLILEEMRLVEGVKIAVAIKTYPDGKVTGKIRSELPIADQVAGYFGGGGHPYAAGFRTYDMDYLSTVRELNKVIWPLLEQAQVEAA